MNALLTNPFKERLRKGEVQIGLWLSSTTAYMAEIAATSERISLAIKARRKCAQLSSARNLYA